MADKNSSELPASPNRVVQAQRSPAGLREALRGEVLRMVDSALDDLDLVIMGETDVVKELNVAMENTDARLRLSVSIELLEDGMNEQEC